jgi:2-oxoglutarate ferredoxin oxidoreductase subunit alpha
MSQVERRVPDEIVLRIAGESGEGVITVGETVARVAARLGLSVLAFRTFPAEIKGGRCMIQLRLSQRPVSYHGERVDFLVAFNREAYEEHFEDLAPGGMLLYEADEEIFPPPCADRFLLPVPFTKIAVSQVKNRLAKNIVAVGVIAWFLGFPLAPVEQLIRERFARRGQAILENNLKALGAGSAHADQFLKMRSFVPIPLDGGEPKLVMSGNEAVALGAIAAGMRYYFGYPITPSTEIMSWLSRNLPKVGGALLQVEDEIAAICGVLGASWAGAKAMTATSGPGLSLMSEAIGLLSMAEIPAVIVDSQRGGPSTGMPTKMEQSDLFLAVYGSHGDAPRIVIAPTSVEDSLEQVVLAFNLAEKYQMPAIVLIDQAISSALATVEPAIFSRFVVIDRERPDDLPAEYRRYAISETGVSVMAIPGMPGGEHVATGLEHDQAGHPKYDERTHTLMSAKRFLKLKALVEDPLAAGLSMRFGPEDAEIGLVCWGSTAGPAEEAVALALEEGIPVKALVPKLLNPLPHREIQEFLGPVRRVLVPEMNFAGQLATLLRGSYNVPTVGLTKVKGVPFTPGEILEKLRELAGAEARRANG